MKRAICLLLCALVLLGGISAVRAGAARMEPGQATLLEGEDTGDSGNSDTGNSTNSGNSDTGNSTDSGNSDTGDSGDSGETETPEPVQLDRPTHLGWGRDYRFLLELYRKQDASRILTDEDGREYVECPGMMYWSTEGLTQNRYRIELYMKEEGDINTRLETVDAWRASGDGGFESNFRFLWDIRKSGTYYFTIQSVGDGTEYVDSETVQSGDWEYEAPEVELNQPTRPRWKTTSESATAYIYPPTAADGETASDTLYRVGYEARWWYTASLTKPATDSGDSGDSGDTEDPTVSKEIGAVLTFYPKHYEFQPSAKMLGEYGSGYYTVQIRALSGDVTKATPSRWSTLSMAQYIAAENTDLETIVSRVNKDTDSYNRQLAINNVRDFGTYRLLELMAADTNNTGAVAAIAELEDITGNYAQPVVSGGLEELFPDKEISVVGAGLNVDLGQSVIFHLGAAHSDEVPSTLYSHAVRFSMQLLDADGTSLTSDGHDLAVPVKITLPVPSTINPSFFVILHHRLDGTVETIPYVALRKTGEQWYASFLVTNFSDFTMAEQVAFLEAKRDETGVNISYRFLTDGVEAAFCAVREASGRLGAVQALELSQTQKTAHIDCDAPAVACLYLLGENHTPAAASLQVQVTP